MPPPFRQLKTILDPSCASSIYRKPSARLDASTGPACNAVLGGKLWEEVAQDRTPELFLLCSLPAKPRAPVCSLCSCSRSDFRFQRWPVHHNGASPGQASSVHQNVCSRRNSSLKYLPIGYIHHRSSFRLFTCTFRWLCKDIKQLCSHCKLCCIRKAERCWRTGHR